MNLCGVKFIESKYLRELAIKAIDPGLSGDDFKSIALELFSIQCAYNDVYREWISHLKIDSAKVRDLHQIPFLPVRFFKSHRVLVNSIPEREPELLFTSSTTTGGIPSQHFVPFGEVYEASFLKGFECFYGKPKDWVILALLPGYLERNGSSLVYMAEKLIQLSGHVESGFYLKDFEGLAKIISELNLAGSKTMLIGVSFGLLDFTESECFFSGNKFNTDKLLVMETGGMKGRRKELTRMELHQHLREAFKVDKIHSEYGMTELLSQAYSDGDGLFNCPPWMKILLRETDNPLQTLIPPSGSQAFQNGGINIIDLANVFSCPFVAVDDIGQLYGNGQFEVLGRFDQAEVRGCNLMVG